MMVLGVLWAAAGCEARSSAEGAQTAVAVAQTALPGLQTAAPGIQATVQVGATQATGVLDQRNSLGEQLQALLRGASVSIQTSPANVDNGQITRVDVKANDIQTTINGLDSRTRQATAIGVLLFLGQYYPSAAISLSVVDASGTTLLHATRSAGQFPSVDVS
jgi:hypothetical protein